MNDQKSMPSPAAYSPRIDQPRQPDRTDLIEEMAREMRVASGGELPHSFCVEQVKRKLARKHAEVTAANGPAALSAGKAQTGVGSVFHSWAMPE